MKITIIIIIIAALIFLLPKIIPLVALQIGSMQAKTQLGPNAQVDTSNNTVAIKDKGTSISVGQSVKVPDNFPTDIPRYPNSTITQTFSPEQNQFSVTWIAKGTDLNTVANFYKSKMIENGWTQTEFTSQPQVVFFKYKKGTRDLQLILTLPQSKDDPQTKDAILISIGY